MVRFIPAFFRFILLNIGLSSSSGEANNCFGNNIIVPLADGVLQFVEVFRIKNGIEPLSAFCGEVVVINQDFLSAYGWCACLH